MQMCSFNHDEICFEVRKCPLCEANTRIEDLQEQLEQANIQIERLDEKLDQALEGL
jgi:hypothetical protein